MAAGRRVRAARVLAGGVGLRELANAAGLSYSHLARVERGDDPLTSSDAVDLGAVLDVPADWLAHGWAASRSRDISTVIATP